jgi:HEPN domain-containing protein
MDRTEIKALAKQAKELSSEANKLIAEGKYREGHSLMKQAVEAGRKCRAIINQSKIDKGLEILEKIHQG